MAGEFDPVEEAELITAAVGQFQQRNPGAEVAKVEVYDLDKMAAHGMKCDGCGAEIETCYWFKFCDACLDERFPAKEDA
jgi:hypothetical protein